MLECIGNIENEDGRVLVRSGDRYFKVGSILWQAVERRQAGQPISAISRWLDLEHPVLHAEKGSHPMLAAIDALTAVAGYPPAPSRITGRMEVDVERIVAPLGRFLKPLIVRPLAYYGLVISMLTVNIAATLGIVPTHGTEPVTDAFLIAASMFMIMAMHEVGHSAVANALGCRTHRIGLGLFVGLPVFYADVSEIWRLQRNRRVLVNLAGVQVQLVIGAGLAVWHHVGNAPPFVEALMTLNLLSVVINLAPFAKLDGYWIVADLLDISDLHRRGWERVKALLRARPDPADVGTAPAVLAYGIGLLAFAVYAIWALSSWIWMIALMVLADPDNGLQKALQTPLSWLAFAYIIFRLVRAVTLVAVRSVKRQTAVGGHA